MSAPSIDEFWRRAAESGLIGSTELRQLKAEFSRLRGAAAQGNTRTLCEWLIVRGTLSRAAGEALYAGRPLRPSSSVPFAATSDEVPVRQIFPESAPAGPRTTATMVGQPRPIADAQAGTSRTLLYAAGALALVAVVLGAATIALLMRDRTPASEESRATETASEPAATADKPAAETEERFVTRPATQPIADDGRTLWASPTDGAAPQFAYLAPGAQILVVMRPREFLTSLHGRQVMAALGDTGDGVLAWIEASTGLRPESIERLDVAFYEAYGPRPVVSLVAHVMKRPAEADLVASWGHPASVVEGGRAFHRDAERCYYLPAGHPQLIIVAPRSRFEEILARGDSPAMLDAYLRQLVETSDGARQLNVYFLPAYLRGARDTLYPGRLGAVRDALDWFLGASSDVLAGDLSINVGKEFFAELRVLPALSKKPRVMARDFHERINQWSPRIQNHLISLRISRYSRETLAGLPFMLQSLAQHARHDAEGRAAIVRCYLPGVAAANLALAADLLLLETAGTADEPAVATSAGPRGTIWERLKQPVSLSFDRDSLENALRQLSTEMGVQIEIVGNDLKLDGITKNQPLSLDLRHRPAEEVLEAIMLLANPDRTVKKLSDSGQKLVYVVKPGESGGAGRIIVTTRAKAAEHGPLPPVFRGEKQ